MNKHNTHIDVITFGEILWDIIDGQPHLGGAPFNLAAHVSLCGLSAAVISRLGSDELGRNALAQAQRLNISREWIQSDNTHPTGTVTVTLANALPSYTIHDQAAWDHIDLSAAEIAAVAASKPGAFCFGSLAQRCATSRRTLSRLLDALSGALIYFDVNLRQNYWSAEILREGLQRTTWLKVNDDEARLLNRVLFSQTEDSTAFALHVLQHYPVSGVLVTCGAEGCLVFPAGQRMIRSPGIAVEVVDTVGAGDAFSAAFLSALLQGRSAEQAAEIGNCRGAMVASKAGAIPLLN